MPYVRIQTWPGHSEEQKKSLAQAVQDDVARCFAIDPGWVTVGIEEVTPVDWDEKVVRPEIEAKPETIYIL